MERLTIVGLGPGPADQLTTAAANALRRASEIVFRDASIPALDPFRTTATVVGLGQSDESIADDLLARPGEPGGVVLAVLGSPRDAAWLPGFLTRAGSAGASVEIVPGRSLLEATIELSGLEIGRPGLQVVGAADLVAAAASILEDPFLGVYRAVDPTRPLVVGAVDAPGAALTERALRGLYPNAHPLRLIRFPLRPDRPPLTEIRVDQLGATLGPGELAWLSIPPLERLDDLASFDTLAYIVARLRAPAGCPWDREQTMQSIKKHLIEETYEAVDALDREAYDKLDGELGDVLLQVVMYAQLGREAKLFDLDDVLRAVDAKLIRRHPHVFGDVKVGSAADVLRNWERIKRGEAGAESAPVSTFGGVPASAPALARADAVQSRAARYGWLPLESLPDSSTVTEPGLDPDQRRRALGALLFDLVALARREQLDPEEALRLATTRFIATFEQVLADCRSRAQNYESLPLDERRRLLAEVERGFYAG